jgi:hypothetical protein
MKPSECSQNSHLNSRLGRAERHPTLPFKLLGSAIAASKSKITDFLASNNYIIAIV